jgi:hypothetical protein
LIGSLKQGPQAWQVGRLLERQERARRSLFAFPVVRVEVGQRVQILPEAQLPERVATWQHVRRLQVVRQGQIQAMVATVSIEVCSCIAADLVEDRLTPALVGQVDALGWDQAAEAAAAARLAAVVVPVAMG